MAFDPISLGVSFLGGLFSSKSKDSAPQTTTQSIPKWLEDASKENIARAKTVGEIGYTPYYGPDVAAFNPTQRAAMQGNMNAAARYGMVPTTGGDPAQQVGLNPNINPMINALQGMPDPQTFAGGHQGYSSGDMFDQAIKEFEARRPGQAAAYNSLFVDPYDADPVADSGGEQLPSPTDFTNYADAYGRRPSALVDYGISREDGGGPMPYDTQGLMDSWNQYQQTGYMQPEMTRQSALMENEGTYGTPSPFMTDYAQDPMIASYMELLRDAEGTS